MATTILTAVLALAGDKPSAYAAAEAAVVTAANRTMLHGDASLFISTLDALAVRKGSTAKRIHSFLLAAHEEALATAADVRPERKGKPTAEQVHQAATLAGQMAERFTMGVQADDAANKERLAAARKDAADKKALMAAPGLAADKVAQQAAKAAATPTAFDVAALIDAIEAGDAEAIKAAQMVAIALSMVPTPTEAATPVHAH